MSRDFDKYLAIANHDIQAVNNMEELKSYVASILYDNDKKAELLQQKENIIKKLDKLIIEFKKQIEEERKNYREIISNFVDKVKELKGSDK